jgi:superfamily I DNA and RNA helicase
VIDASQARYLPDLIQSLFDRRSNSTSAHVAVALEVHAFLSELVEVLPDIDSMREFAHKESRRLSGGLSTWARRLEMTPFRLRVTGTAGSGKTQLALMELQAAHARGLSTMYVCFNRPLAEAMRQAAPEPAAITTFHELGAWAMRAAGAVIDFSDPEIFNKQARAVIDAAKDMSQSLDLLVIDEGQDFEAEWAQALEHLVKPNGRAIWLEAPEQRLYKREPVTLPGWVRLHSPVNYRSPRVITTLIEQLGLNDYPMEAGSSFQGFDPSMRSYSDEVGQIRETGAAVEDLLQQGYLPSDIVVLSWQGLDRTVTTRAEAIAGKSTRRFTGRYSESGEAIYTEGELRIETVHRFKGQAADCIVLTGVDFEKWTSDAKRRLFVAMTRARIRITLVVGSVAENQILASLSGG